MSRKMHYLWNNLNISPGNYQALTQYLWRKTLHEEILEPIEDADQRFQFIRTTQDPHIGAILSAWEGQANMKIHQPEFK